MNLKLSKNLEEKLNENHQKRATKREAKLRRNYEKLKDDAGD